MLNVTLIPILSDNYAYLIQSGEDIAIIDPGESKIITDKLHKEKLSLHYIFNTHHHYDHTDGNKEIQKEFNCKIIAPQKEADQISDLDLPVNDGDEIIFGNETIKIIETAGHTSGHICFYFPQSQILFSGDTLFSMGCGRLFEGTAEDMFQSFEKLKNLPDDTQVYCGHEYTKSNGEFCLSIEPDNQALQERMKEVQSLLKSGKPTIPTTIGLEKKTNAFMRAKTVEEFKVLRDLKDSF